MYRRLYLTLLLIGGLVLFAFTLLAAVREINPEWKQHQAKYKDLFVTKAGYDDELAEKARSFSTGHQQIYLSKLKQVDRCMNCHIGVENPLMADEEVPYKTHSGRYLEDHPIAKFGCTVCHEGQGRATNKKEAHAVELKTHWDTPILPIRYIESSCAKCHDSKMLQENGYEKLVKGEKLFSERGCLGCHKLDGVGGVLGKALDGIGSQPKHYFSLKHIEGDKTTYAWLFEHFMDPRKIVPESDMRVVLTEEEAELLTTYALTIRNDEAPKIYRRIAHYSEKPMDGEALYKKYCIACHSDGRYSIYDEIFERTIPAIMNPAFTRSISDEHMQEIVRDGRAGTEMTAWNKDAAGLSDSVIEKIVEYVARNRPDEKPEPFNLAGFIPDVKHGEDLYNVRCALCHGEDGKGGRRLLGLNLRTKGDDSEFIALTVRDGRPGTPMVPFGIKGVGLADRDIADMTAYVKTLTGKK